MSDDKIVQFTRRLINEWPRQVYLADFGDGDGTQVFATIQHPDDTTPLYTRSDLSEAAIAAAREEGRKAGIREAADEADSAGDFRAADAIRALLEKDTDHA